MREHQRHHAENERKRSHDDRPQARLRGQASLRTAGCPHSRDRGQLDDQDRVLARQADQNDEAHLHENVESILTPGRFRSSAQQAHRHHENHRQWQRPTFVQRRQHQKHQHHRADERHERILQQIGQRLRPAGSISRKVSSLHSKSMLRGNSFFPRPATGSLRITETGTSHGPRRPVDRRCRQHVVRKTNTGPTSSRIVASAPSGTMSPLELRTRNCFTVRR